MKRENTLTLTFAKHLILNISAYAYFDKDIAADIQILISILAKFPGKAYIHTIDYRLKP